MEQESFQELLRSPVVQLAAPLVTGLIGFILGNRLAIGRDRRNEYNVQADRMRTQLIKMRGSYGPCIAEVSAADWDLLLRHTGALQSARLRQAMADTVEAEKKDTRNDPIGQHIFGDRYAMDACRERLIALLPRR